MLCTSIFLQAQCSVDFGSTAGTFTFAPVSGSDIVNGGSSGANATSTQNFNIWNEGATPLDCNTAGGVDDITFDFEIFHAFDVYGVDGIIDTYAGSTHDITQSASGLKGVIPMGSSSANETSTGDVRGYKITVTFANNIDITADEMTVNTASVNTGGRMFESAAVTFLDDTGTAYGTITYEGFYGNGSSGASTDGTCTAPASGTPWSTTGTGVYTMYSTGSTSLDPMNPCNAIVGTSGVDNNKNVDAVADAGLNPTDKIGGFIFIVYSEDIAPSAAPGANTSTSSAFSSTITGFTIAAPLPVELTSFTAKSTGEDVTLYWNTASELDNDFFSVEHSFDGINFEKIGKVKGAGESTSSQNYKFTHLEPNVGLNYYRIKQVDFDGKYESSDIVFVKFKKEEQLNIYPTTTKTKINVTLPENGKDISYTIFNYTGQVIQSGEFENNTLTGEVNVETIPVGYYFIQIKNKSFTETFRFCKI